MSNKNALTEYLGGGEQAVNLGEAVKPFLSALWLIGGAARAHVYKSPKPDVNYIAVEYTAGPRVVDVLEALDFVDDGAGNFSAEIDGKRTTFFGVNIAYYITDTVFAGDGIAVRLDNEAAVVSPDFWTLPPDTEIRQLKPVEDEEIQARTTALYEKTKVELQQFHAFLESKAAEQAGTQVEVKVGAFEPTDKLVDEQLELELSAADSK